MAEPMAYLTVARYGEAVTIEKKSRFIGRAAPVESEEAALALLRDIQAAHRDASHNCYAYRLRQDNLMRYSDDGEPGGTAGLPMMNVLLGQQLVDVIVVVTRYFGGTLLGAGGLVRAYTKATQQALAAAEPSVMTACDTAQCSVHYNCKERMEALIARHCGGVLELEYGASLLYTYFTPTKKTPAFELALSELTLGAAKPRHMERGYRPIPADPAGD